MDGLTKKSVEVALCINDGRKDDSPILVLFFTLKQIQSEKGRVMMIRSQDMSVRNQPHRPIPSSTSST